ncbi:leucine-rich repeat-containing 15-like [Brachionus plicatilis]|uniref:Leucine-rich repeat-containing 15-like n=1 Tax=Brachionus plicatilis TaxID=10195 RepID=A0A3M7S440_BRAPC|nr:leucine-rich repeat-containing 15-like [Brachionus plicatilis]
MERTSVLTNDYFSNLIKQITAQANKIISTTQNSEQETISNLKNLLISSVNEIQIPDMNKNFSKTGLFIPNRKIDEKKNNLNFKNKIGKLVILEDQIDFFVLSNLSKIFKDNLSADDLDFKTFKEALETTILQKLIELKSMINDPIIDLTNIGKNHLEKLTIDGKKSKFNENDFNEIVKLINCKKLDEFYLFYKNENFQRIHVDSFANFQNLKKLVIKCDHLNLIKSKNFSMLSNLEYLSITESKINKIEKGAFHGLIHLKWLFLSSNEITNIEAENFTGLDHLEYLILNQNKIESIENKTFAALVNLKALEMVENRINSLSENSFDGLFSLKILNLNNKSGLRIDDKAFNSLSSLEVLDLASNTIEHLDSLPNFYASETEIDEMKKKLYLQITDCESEWIYFQNMLDVSDQVRNAILTSEMSISHYENIASL